MWITNKLRKFHNEVRENKKKIRRNRIRYVRDNTVQWVRVLAIESLNNKPVFASIHRTVSWDDGLVTHLDTHSLTARRSLSRVSTLTPTRDINMRFCLSVYPNLCPIVSKLLNKRHRILSVFGRHFYAPPLIGGGIKRCFCLTPVCRVHRA